MIAGHFGFAAAVKAREPSVALWALMLGCQWLDVVFVPLFLAGMERMESIAGTPPNAYGASIIHADYTHSLVGAAVLSLLFGAVAGLRYGRRTAVVLGLVAFSHWLLDIVMHREDMPLLPGGGGGLPSLGLGLWRWQGVSAAIELALVVAGAWMYWRAARGVAGPSRRADLCGAAVLGSGVLTLVLNLAGM